MISKSKAEATRSAADGSSLGRARRALGSIGERLLEVFTDSSAQEAEHKHRLRGVLLRDRELLAVDHDRTRHGAAGVPDPVSAPAVPSAPAQPVAPPRAETIARGVAAAPAPQAEPARPSAPDLDAPLAPSGASTPRPAPPPPPGRAPSSSAAPQVRPTPPPPPPPAARSAAPPVPPASKAHASKTIASAVASTSPRVTARATSVADDSDDTLDEPIRTRSMARLLAGQGHHRRALSIYDALLAEPGADSSLQAEADELRSRLAT